MACNCGKKKGQGYIVHNPNGSKTKVPSLSAAMSQARKVGGTYTRATA